MRSDLKTHIIDAIITDATRGESAVKPDKSSDGDKNADPRNSNNKRKESLKITVDVKTNTLTIAGPTDTLQLAKKLIEDMDKPTLPGPANIDPLLRKYSVPPGTADAVAKSLQDGMPTIKVIALPVTNEIMVMATDKEHADIAIKLKSCNKEKK